MTPEQCRAARALVSMSQDKLALASGVAKRTIASFELGSRVPYAANLDALQIALESAGVVFIANGAVSLTGGGGVRMRDRPQFRNNL